MQNKKNRPVTILLFTLFLISVSITAAAQDYLLDSLPPAVDKVIDHNANCLFFPETAAAFDSFFQKMDRIKKGHKEKVHIMHIGGSHLQADFYSNKLRTYFQNMSSAAMGQRGFIYPYHLAKTHNPRSYKVHGYDSGWKGYRCSISRDSAAWGLSGISGRYKDSLEAICIQANHRNYTRKPYVFNKLRVFYNDWEGGYDLELLEPDLVKSSFVNKKYHFKEFELTQEVTEANLSLRKNTPSEASFLMMGLELLHHDTGVEYTSIGVNGASFKSYARCALFQNQLELYKPDLFIVSIGTNDTYTRNFKPKVFKQRYRRFIETVKNTHPNCALLLTVPNDSYYRRRYPNRNTRKAAKVIYELAEEYKAAVWDLYAVMGGLGSSQTWYKNGLMVKDRIHFSRRGYSVKADLLLNAMTSHWESLTEVPEGSILQELKQPLWNEQD